VVDGLLRLHPFTTLYIADLDALTGRGSHRDVVLALQRDYPTLRFWLDQGWAAPVGTALPVIGTESLDTGRASLLPELGGDFILSLDFIEGCVLGEASVLDDATHWPQTVIVMSLSHVGAGAGPDFQRLQALRTRHPEKTLVAAGGVRHGEDLRRLQELGVGGVLLASALHAGAISPEELREFA
jgi:phosphoribosylformimino-5-aminoimidazole carboxamide ribotide isomerase